MDVGMMAVISGAARIHCVISHRYAAVVADFP